ncbi:MAG: glutathione S-transferase domain-containing protein [Atopobiaceae bacterium]|nr:glutathione S-transferase domain-containing protein [Atopobiaceae bacterium]
MNKQLDLYYFPSCPYCRRVLSAMERLGINDKITLYNIHQDRDADQRLVSVGGKRQVPCLFIDGKPLYESADIVAYLEDTVAHAG